jgi:hypothetical protein
MPYTNNQKIITNRKLRGFFIAALLLLLSDNLWAATLKSTITCLSSNLYRAQYIFINTGSLTSSPIESFDIALPTSTILSFTNTAGWTESTVGVFGDSYFVMDIENGAGLSVGSALQFSVDFIWTGTGQPGSQVFSVYDLTPFALLGSGSSSVTQAFACVTNDNDVPIPFGFLVALAAILTASSYKFKRLL